MQQVTLAFVLAAALRLAGLALNNIVVMNAQAVVLLYGLPLSAILGSLWVIERNRRTLRSSRLVALFEIGLEAISAPFKWLASRVRPPAAARGARG
jgi:lipopolysaccharide export system permease protein